jgi:hypothetical protein
MFKMTTIMKNILPVLFLAILAGVWGCGQKSNDNGEHDHDHHEQTGDEGNQELYDEVMKVHDEVMPKMNDIYKLKEELKKEIAGAPDMVEEKKKAIESMIAKLDSASESMMVWMRNFNPLPDSLGEEKAREYLEDQKKKVKKVKEDMLKAIEEAKALD